MLTIELIGVLFDGYGRSQNQTRAAAVLRDAGLAAAFNEREVRLSADLALPAQTSKRAAGSGLMNEAALIAMTDQLHLRVGEALTANRFPIVYGADCSVLLGAISALGDQTGEAGLMFVDGHEDTTPLDASNGEGATSELGLLLGITGKTAPAALKKRLPALSENALAMLGMRDYKLRREANVASLSERGVWLRSHAEVSSNPAQCARQAAAHVAARVSGWWLHTDLDVLAQNEFIAQRVPGDVDEIGGLAWAELTALAAAALQAPGCRGWSVSIYDPEQDPDRSEAKRIVRFISEVARHIP